MTKLLEQAVEAARALPPESQDDIARVVLHLAGNEEPPVVLLRRGTRRAHPLESCRRPWRVCHGRTGAGGLGQARLVKLRYTLPALDDLKAVFDYIDRQSPQGARPRPDAHSGDCRSSCCSIPMSVHARTIPLTRRVVAPPYPYPDFLPRDGRRARYSWGAPQRPPSLVHAGVTNEIRLCASIDRRPEP